MAFENVTISGTYKYAFHVTPPNSQDADGIIRSSIIYEYGDHLVYNPDPVYKAKEDVLAYQAFVISQGYPCITIIEVVSINHVITVDYDTIAFHKSINDANQVNIKLWNDWYNAQLELHKKQRTLAYIDMNYIASEDLSNIQKYPYWQKGGKNNVTGVQTYQIGERGNIITAQPYVKRGIRDVEP